MPELKMHDANVASGSASRPTRVWNIVGIVLCVILVPILVINCVLLVKGMVNEDEVPGIGGLVPLIVLTESMEPEIDGGDMIICRIVKPEDVKVGDVISFFDPEGSGTSVVTHRVMEIETDPQTGALVSWRTQGDNNEIEDRLSVPVENLVGIWTDIRIPFLGSVIMFMQSTLGLVVCIFVPIAALVAYEVIRRKKQDIVKQSDIDTLRAELEALKAARAQAETNEETPTEGTPAPTEEQPKDAE